MAGIFFPANGRACAGVSAILGWCRFLAAEGIAEVNMQRLKLLARPDRQKYVRRAEQPPDYYDMSRIVDYAANLIDAQVSNEHERLRALRDRALIITLADTGMEVNSISGLALEIDRLPV